MKKIFIFTLAALLLSGYTYAQNTDFETMETVFTFKATHTIPVSYSQKIKDSILDGNHREVVTEFLKSCEPFNENVNINFFGFNFDLNAKSNGWVNEKCSYEFYGNINSISSHAKQMLNITADDDEITSIKPKFECNFNKKQLETFVTEIMAASSPRGIKSKEAIYKPAQNDLKSNKKRDDLISLLTDSSVCRIVNEEDLMKALQVFSSSPITE